MIRNINLKYVEEKYDENGVLSEYQLKIPEDFNFAYDVVDDIAAHEPNRRAMFWVGKDGEERNFTFGDMKRWSDKTANYLRSLGIKKGDPVMVVLKRHYQFWFCALALHKLGAVLIPATYMMTAHDVKYRVDSASVMAVICTADGDVGSSVEQAEPECPTVKLKMMVNGAREGWLDFDAGIAFADEHFERVATNVHEPMLLYFSSGTSGYPKMVLHDYSYALGHLLTAKHWHCVVPDGLHMSIADTGWGKAVWGKLYGQWLMEAGVFTYDMDKFVPAEILTMVGKYKLTTLCCPPTMFRMFINEGLEKYDLSSLKHTTIAGEALNPDVFNKWYEATGLKLMEGFGQTETTLAICNTKGMTPKPGSMGKPSPQYQIDLVDSDGQSCPNGTTGEIVIKYEPHPPGLMCEYYRNEAKTAEVMHDGWYHTGDTAWRDEDGYIWYVGRNDDIIKSSGYRIGPFEVESVLVTHPAVLECAVTGTPDPVRGQLVKATIVLRPGFTPSDALIKELQEHVKRETAPYKYPRVVEFVDKLPKTINGKIRRVEIREKG